MGLERGISTKEEFLEMVRERIEGWRKKGSNANETNIV